PPAVIRNIPDLATLRKEVFKSTVDGDSFRLEGGRQVRMLSIDSPEHDEPFFAEARAKAKSLLDKREVWLEFDAEKEDDYGRYLAYVWIRPEPNGPPVLLQAELLRAGTVRFYGHRENSRHSADLLEMQNEARRARRGVWGLPPPPPAPYYVSSRTGERFHRPDCDAAQHISGAARQRFDDRERALDSGKSPCRTCKP
ncbi:MAG: thermonuclease family protein, partial [Planctomycetes bacterium]|nr:thermonuclease family protein [Planctomycetota bacterium]